MKRVFFGWYVWAGLLAALVMSLLLKFPCSYHPWDGYQYQSWCYNDVMALYGVRHFNEHLFPYLASSLEYPVGIGLVAGTIGLITNTLGSFFLGNSLVLAIMAAIVLLCLRQLLTEPPAGQKRLLIFALAPTLILYGFLNWDLLAVAMMMLGLVAYQRERDSLAGFWLGIGAAVKLFPIFLLPGLLLNRGLVYRRLHWQMVAGAVGGFLFLNLPIYLLNPVGWWYPWKFQAERFPNFETIWFFIYDHFGVADAASFWWTIYPKLTSGVSLGLFIVLLTIYLFLEWRRQRNRPFVVVFITLILFLLTAKIFSPQYLLWLLPFLVILPLPRQAIVGFFAVDLLTWTAIAHFLLVADTPAGAGPLAMLEIAVALRYLMLGYLAYLAYRLPDDDH